MWAPYFCSMRLCLYSEIQWYIPHKRLNRLHFCFRHSVFSLLLVDSKEGSSRILIGMKSTSEFSALKNKAVFGSFPLLFCFTLRLYGDYLCWEIKRSRQWIVKYLSLTTPLWSFFGFRLSRVFGQFLLVQLFWKNSSYVSGLSLCIFVALCAPSATGAS